MRGDENKIYDTLYLEVFHNDSGEIFIKNKYSGHELKISDVNRNLKVVASGNCVLIPSNYCMSTYSTRK